MSGRMDWDRVNREKRLRHEKPNPAEGELSGHEPDRDYAERAKLDRWHATLKATTRARGIDTR